MSTPDIGLSFALWLIKTRQSFFKQLILCKESLRHISIWDIGESGGFFHHYDNQHENYFYKEHEYKASRHDYTSYFPERNLPLDKHRPSPYKFSNGSQQYPLEGTAHINICPNCIGSGSVECGKCGGIGIVTRTDSEGDSERVICPSCGGRGQKECSRCSGEGKLLTYQSKDYTWKYTTDDEPIVLPIIDRHSVKNLISKTHQKSGSYPVNEFSKDEIIEKSGVYNERIEALIEYACERGIKKEEEIDRRFGTLLFQQRNRFYIPLGFVNLFVNQKFGQFFVAGNINYRKSNSPPARWSLLKLCGWFALGLVISLWTGLAHGFIVMIPILVHRIIIIISGIAISLGVLRFILDFFVQSSDTWMISDDDGYGGWLFVHLLVQAVSLNRKGKLLDPCYTDLFNPPTPNTRESRNSFFCAVEIGKDKEKQITELFLVSQRALSSFINEIKVISKEIQTWVWIIRQPNFITEADKQIADLLKSLPPKRLNKIRLMIIVNTVDNNVSLSSREQFPEVTKYLSPQQVKLHCFSLTPAFEDLQNGKLSPNTVSALDKLMQTTGILQNKNKSNLQLKQ